MITKFEIKQYTAIFSEKGKINIKPGCAYDYDEAPKLIASFDSLIEACEALEVYRSNVHMYDEWGGGREYRVTEYGVSEDYYDDDGEWCDHNGIWKFSSFKFDIVSGYNDETVMQCSDMETALWVLSVYEEMWPDSYMELNGQWGGTWNGSVKVVNFSGDIMELKTAAAYMDDELREKVNDRLAPCLEQEFFNEYCREHEKKFGEEFMLP